MKNRFFFIEKGFIYVKDLSGEIRKVVPKINIDIQRLSLDELFDMSIYSLNYFFSQENLTKTLHIYRPSDFFIAVNNNKIVHISYICQFKKSEFIIRGSRTLECYRGLSIAPAVFVYIMRYLKGKGIKKIFVSTASWNKNSQRCFAKSGIQKKYKTSYHVHVFKKVVKFAI